MIYDLLNAINTSKDEWSIRVRICRIWESRNWKNNNELMSLDMVLIDEKGNSVHATIRKTQISKFKHLLQEGHLYEVKNFRVVPNNGEYKPVMGEYRIFFQIDTVVRRNKEEAFEVPRYGFQFVDLATLESRLNKNTVLSDVMGCLSGIGGIEIVGINKRQKRDLEIITHENVPAKITLWGAMAEKFNSASYDQNEGPCILVATSMTVKKFRGVIDFWSSTATKLYVNLDIPEVHSMMERFSRLQTGVQILASEPEVTVHEQMFTNRLTVKELLDKNCQKCPSDIKEQYITVRATITDIGTSSGWYYLACFVCTKKVAVSERTYFCSNCNQEGKYPLPMFKIQLNVSDETASSTFMLFNKEAEKLLDSTVTKILHEQEQNVENDDSEEGDSIPVQLLKLRGKNFIFRLKVNKFNLKKGRENYSVSRVYEVDENLEHEYEEKKIKKRLGGEDTEDNVYVQQKSSMEKLDTTLDQAEHIGHHKGAASAGKGKKNVPDLEGEKIRTSAGKGKRKEDAFNKKVDIALEEKKKGRTSAGKGKTKVPDLEKEKSPASAGKGNKNVSDLEGDKTPTSAVKGKRKVDDFNKKVDVALEEVKKGTTSAGKGKTKVHDLEDEKSPASAGKGNRKIPDMEEEKKHATKRRRRSEHRLQI